MKTFLRMMIPILCGPLIMQASASEKDSSSRASIMEAEAARLKETTPAGRHSTVIDTRNLTEEQIEKLTKDIAENDGRGIRRILNEAGASYIGIDVGIDPGTTKVLRHPVRGAAAVPTNASSASNYAPGDHRGKEAERLRRIRDEWAARSAAASAPASESAPLSRSAGTSMTVTTVNLGREGSRPTVTSKIVAVAPDEGAGGAASAGAGGKLPKKLEAKVIKVSKIKGDIYT